MIALRTDGMLYDKTSYTLVGVWPISTNSLKEAPPTLAIVGKQRELVFKLMTGVQDVCAVYEYRNSQDYYMLKLYWTRTAMLAWWNKARGT
jgi:hypothetical protein